MADWKINYAPATTAMRRRELARFLHALIAAGATPEIAAQLNRVRTPGPRATTATDEELGRLHIHAPTWLRFWLCATAGHALRFGEAEKLCPANYDGQQKTITFEIPKTGATNTLPASGELQAYFSLVQPVADPNTTLLTLIAGKPLSRPTIQSAWKALKKKAGVNPQLRIHDLRRTLARRIYRETKDLVATQQLLGHKHLTSTLTYLVHFDPAAIRPILNQLRGGAPQWKN